MRRGRHPEIQDKQTICFVLGRPQYEYFHAYHEHVNSELDTPLTKSAVMRRILDEHRAAYDIPPPGTSNP